jgi:hypothetical protein
MHVNITSGNDPNPLPIELFHVLNEKSVISSSISHFRLFDAICGAVGVLVSVGLTLILRIANQPP